jgi:hypothetical protein
MIQNNGQPNFSPWWGLIRGHFVQMTHPSVRFSQCKMSIRHQEASHALSLRGLATCFNGSLFSNLPHHSLCCSSLGPCLLTISWCTLGRADSKSDNWKRRRTTTKPPLPSKPGQLATRNPEAKIETEQKIISH